VPGWGAPAMSVPEWTRTRPECCNQKNGKGGHNGDHEKTTNKDVKKNRMPLALSESFL